MKTTVPVSEWEMEEGDNPLEREIRAAGCVHIATIWTNPEDAEFILEACRRAAIPEPEERRAYTMSEWNDAIEAAADFLEHAAGSLLHPKTAADAVRRLKRIVRHQWAATESEERRWSLKELEAVFHCRTALTTGAKEERPRIGSPVMSWDELRRALEKTKDK